MIPSFRNLANRKAPVPQIGVPEVRPAMTQEMADAAFGDVPLPAATSSEAADQQLREYLGVPSQKVAPPTAEDKQGVPPIEDSPVNPVSLDASSFDLSPLASRQRTVIDPNMQSDLLTPEQIANPEVPVTSSDYATQYQREQGRRRDFSDAFQAMETQYDEQGRITSAGDYGKAASIILGEANDKVDFVSPSEKLKFERTETEITNASDRVAPALQVISSESRRNLISTSSGVYDTRNPDARKAKGYALMEEVGLDGPGMQAISDMAGLAYYTLLSQVPKAKKEAEEDFVVDPNSGAVDSDNLVSGMGHFIRNMATNVGLVEPTPGFFDSISSTYIEAEVQKGNFAVNRDSNGKLQYFPKDPVKSMAKKVGVVARIATGRLGRRPSSKTPNVAGSPLGSEQLTTKKSVTTPSLIGQELDMSKAEATKDMMGSVGYTYLKQHVAALERFFTAAVSQDYMVDTADGGVYSTHPMAERYGLSQKDFNKIKNNQVPPRDEKARASWNPDREAGKIMRNLIKQKGMILQAIKGAEGVRFGEYMHSIVNHRYFINSFDLDFMGSKDMIRDILNFGERDVVYGATLFNESKVEDLKTRATAIFNNADGLKRQKEMLELNPSDLAAIGTMVDAVLNYYTAIKPNPEILKMPDKDLIKLFNMDVANSLASLGAEFEAYMLDPEGDTNNKHTNILSYVAGIPKGEFLASAGLWDDLFQLKRDSEHPTNKNLGRRITHTSVSDGTQSGLFIQAMQHGNATTAARLGRSKYDTEEKALRDMRDETMASFIEELGSVNKDSDEARQAWDAFFANLPAVYRDDFHAMSNEFFKAPLMQVSYSKDAGMFQGFLEDTMSRSNIEPLVKAHLLPHFGTLANAAANANIALEFVLRNAIDSESVRNLSSIGYGMAILDKPLIYRGITGDHVLVSPAGMINIRKNTNYNNYQTDEYGFKYLTNESETIDMMVDDGTGNLIKKSVARKRMGLNPSYSKPTQYYYDNQAKVFRPYKSFAGSSLSRQAAVMPTQAIDAGYVTLTMLEVNKGLSRPRPVTWVHDSIISTGANSLIYRNAYNNITIPRAIKRVAKTNGDIFKAYKEAKEQELQLIARKGVVGIGADGEYPSMGAFFDSVFFQYLDPNTDYKRVYLKKRKKDGSPRSESDWKAAAKKAEDFLLDAQEYGWVPPNVVAESQRVNMAVSASEFNKLFDLFNEYRNISDLSLKTWADNSEREGLKAGKHLIRVASYGGIHQMAPSGGSRPVLTEMITNAVNNAQENKKKRLEKEPAQEADLEPKGNKEAPTKSRRDLLKKAQESTAAEVPSINAEIPQTSGRREVRASLQDIMDKGIRNIINRDVPL